jgi:uncharacterized membrane protein YozB (DUF420 family)
LVNDLLATVAWLALVAGWTQRRVRGRHVPLVLFGIGLDLALVVHLEISRSVVEKTMTDHLPAVRWLHIATSAAAVVLYLPTLWLGFRMLRDARDPALRRRHRMVANAALVLRTLGFLFMWGVEAAPK